MRDENGRFVKGHTGVNRKGKYLTCITCGKVYYVPPYISERSKYCSRNCYNNKPGKKIRIVCACGKVFYDYPSNNRTFCSRKCAEKYRLVPQFSRRKGPRPERQKRVKKICETCGKEFEVCESRGDIARFCCHKCYGEWLTTQTGPKSSAWRGGTRQRNVAKVGEWRRQVFKRDNYTCQMCGSKKDIQAHHVFPWADYPLFRFEIDNGTTLCIDCHSEVHGRRMRKYSVKPTMVCEVCGVEFEYKPCSTLPPRRFCGNKCSWIYKRQHPEEYPNLFGLKIKIVKNCEHCGKEMILRPSYKQKRFCSVSCCNEYRKAHYDEFKHIHEIRWGKVEGVD